MRSPGGLVARTTRLHLPRHEIWVGVPTPGTEVPERVDAILAALAGARRSRRRRTATTCSSGSTTASSSRFLAARCRGVGGGSVRGAGRPGPGGALLLPDRGAARRHGADAARRRCTREAGQYCYDTMTLVGPGHLGGRPGGRRRRPHGGRPGRGRRPAAYALCRPPGHHVTPSGYGGSCYLNNAAVAAEALRDAGHDRVAVVDIDAHHGNGTQAVFWERPDVLYGSLHVDPGAGWFPHVFGLRRRDRGRGRAGATLNLPLPGAPVTAWLAAVADLAAWVEAPAATRWSSSLGVDAAGDDPESPLQVTAEGFRAAGQVLGGLGLPSVLVQEGATTSRRWAGWWPPTSTGTAAERFRSPDVPAAVPQPCRRRQRRRDGGQHQRRPGVKYSSGMPARGCTATGPAPSWGRSSSSPIWPSVANSTTTPQPSDRPPAAPGEA